MPNFLTYSTPPVPQSYSCRYSVMELNSKYMQHTFNCREKDRKGYEQHHSNPKPPSLHPISAQGMYVYRASKLGNQFSNKQTRRFPCLPCLRNIINGARRSHPKGSLIVCQMLVQKFMHTYMLVSTQQFKPTIGVNGRRWKVKKAEIRRIFIGSEVENMRIDKCRKSKPISFFTSSQGSIVLAIRSR